MSSPSSTYEIEVSSICVYAEAFEFRYIRVYNVYTCDVHRYTA